MRLRSLAYSILLLGVIAASAGAQSLVIGLPANINTLDPHMSGSIGTDLTVISHIYDSLVSRNADLKIEPAIATSWRTLDDRTWEFTLRPGVRFPDGELLDSKAVQWNIQRVLEKKNNARIRPWFTSIDRVDTPSPATVLIHTKTPFPSLLAQLSILFLMPPQWTSSHKPAMQAMGTGPYDLREYVPGDHVTLTARANYWRAKPQFQTVTFRVLTEPSSRTFALLSHEVDFVRNVSMEDIGRINQSGRATARKLSASRATIIKFNTLRPPFQDNVNLRLALNYAVDKETIHDTILGGTGDVLKCQVLTPAYFGFNPALQAIPYDPEKARQLLKASGLPPHSIIDLDVPVGTYFEDDQIAQAIAGQIEEVLGIGIRIHEMDFSLYMNKYLKSRNMAAMEYIAQAWPSLDADGLLALFASDSPYAYWNEPAFDAALVKGKSTMDPAERKLAYAQATEKMCEQAPVLFLFAEPLTYGTTKGLIWHARPDDWVRASDFTIQGGQR